MKLYGRFTTQEEIDDQYDLEAVLDMERYGSWMQESSDRARQELSVELNVSFGPTLDETLDIFPSNVPGSPVLMFIHGGWWRALSKNEFSLVARGLVAHDITVVVTNYSLAPKVSISEITRQSRAALAWTFKNVESFNGDPDAIFVAGHSAGGHQVGMLAVTDWQGEYGMPGDVIRGGIPISGLFDLEPFKYSWLQPKLLLTHETIKRQSPLFHVGDAPYLPPLLVTLGGDESPDFHRQSATFASAWRNAGGSVSTLDQPGRDHISAIQGFEDPSSPLCRAVVDFIETNRPRRDA